MNFLQRGKSTRCILAAAFLFAALPSLLLADAGEDWNKITAMDAGPQVEAKTRDEALKLTLTHIAAQEKALRAFISDYPGDPHGVEARLRLSHLLAIRSDWEGKPELYESAFKILDDLMASPALPEEKRVDVAYARVTLYMHQMPNPDAAERERLLAYVLEFKKDYPTDHRNGDLLVEIASAYDSDPEKKHDLLDAAFRYADTPELKARINDDFKRLAMLGKPLDLKFDSVQGEHVDIAAYRGKVVMVYFFAGWSTPSLLGLESVKKIADAMPKNKFQLVGISLDSKKEALLALIDKLELKCPIYFDTNDGKDGRGWENPLVRSLGINTLPTVWLVDKKGNLRVLNAIVNADGMAQALMKEND